MGDVKLKFRVVIRQGILTRVVPLTRPERETDVIVSTWEYGELEIPGKIEGIGELAFREFWLKCGVCLPAGVRWIGEEAFQENQEFCGVTMGQGLQEIGARAFQGTCECAHFNLGKLPDGLVSLGEEAFCRCGVEQITVPGSLQDIEYGTFEKCQELRRVVLKEGVRCIGADAFLDCGKLREVEFPPGLQEIQEGAFQYCGGLKTLVLKKGLQEIGPKAFENAGLNTVTLPEGLRVIRESAFAGCTTLPQIRIPEGMEELGASAFACCRALRTVELPASLRRICRDAFSGCWSLEHISLPEGLEIIEEGVFSECTSLKSLTIPASVRELGPLAAGASHLQRVTVLGRNALSFATGLTPLSDLMELRVPALSPEELPPSLRTPAVRGLLAMEREGQPFPESHREAAVKHLQSLRLKVWREQPFLDLLLDGNCLSLGEAQTLAGQAADEGRIEFAAALLEYVYRKFSPGDGEEL